VTLFCQYFRNSLLVRKRNQLHWQEHVWELVICAWSGGCQHVFVLGRSSPKSEPISVLSLCYSCVVEIIVCTVTAIYEVILSTSNPVAFTRNRYLSLVIAQI